MLVPAVVAEGAAPLEVEVADGHEDRSSTLRGKEGRPNDATIEREKVM
jgi:hypothetical protein